MPETIEQLEGRIASLDAALYISRESEAQTKERLQAVSEELITVRRDLQKKIDARDQALVELRDELNSALADLDLAYTDIENANFALAVLEDENE